MNRQQDHSGEETKRALPIDLGDLAITAILLVGCFYLYYETTKFDEVSEVLGQNILPEQFPRILLYIIGALALVLPFEKYFQPEPWKKSTRGKDGISTKTWITILFILAVVLLSPYLGTVLTILTVTISLPLLWGERRWLLILIFGMLFTAAVTFLFEDVLKVYFEPGLFKISLFGH